MAPSVDILSKVRTGSLAFQTTTDTSISSRLRVASIKAWSGCTGLYYIWSSPHKYRDIEALPGLLTTQLATFFCLESSVPHTAKAEQAILHWQNMKDSNDLFETRWKSVRYGHCISWSLVALIIGFNEPPKCSALLIYDNTLPCCIDTVSRLQLATGAFESVLRSKTFQTMLQISLALPDSLKRSKYSSGKSNLITAFAFSIHLRHGFLSLGSFRGSFQCVSPHRGTAVREKFMIVCINDSSLTISQFSLLLLYRLSPLCIIFCTT